MDIKSTSEFLNPLKLQYKYDDTLQFNNNYINTDEGYKVFLNNALLNTRDHSINNYNIFYLTDNKKLSDIVNIDDSNIINNKKHLISYIKIGDYYLSTSGEETGIQISEDKVNQFEICFLDKNKCYIKTFISNNLSEIGEPIGTMYYISKILDITTNIDDKCEFNYILDDNKLYLFVIDEGVLTLDPNNLVLIFSKTNSSNYFNNNQTFIIENNNIEDVNINTSFGVYKNRSLDIDTNKSIYDLSNNYLITSEYSYADGDNIDVDILALKNQLTPRGYSSRTNLNPDINYREYTSLFTGTNQELGNSLISLNYNYNITDLQIKPGLNTFTTPTTLSPYGSSININDIDFQKSGAFGFTNPSLADKIYKINDNNLIKSYAWLSCNSLDDKGIWLSRYYNPLLTNVQNISSSPAKIIQNITDIDKIFYENNEIINDGYIDIISNLQIEPNTTYVYKRITNKEIENFNQNKHLVLSSIKLLNTKDSAIYNDNIINNIYDLNGDSYAVLPLKNYIYDNQLSLSFYLNSNDYTKVIGEQILGNLNCYGFSFKKNSVITPIPMISFTGGVSFGIANDIWDQINSHNNPQWVNQDTWATYKLLWNQFLYKGELDVTGQYLFNTDLQLIDLLPTTDTFIRTVRIEHTDFYYSIYAKQILRMTPLGIEMLSFDFSNEDSDENIIYVNYDENNIYCITDQHNVYEVSYNSEKINKLNLSSIDTSIPFNTCFKHDNKYYFANNLSGISEYDPRFGIFYDSIVTNDIERYTNKHCIYYYNPNVNNTEYNIITNDHASKFFTAKSIQDFKIIDDYIGIIYNNSKINIYNIDRDLLFTYDFSKDDKTPVAFDYVGEITPNGYEQYFIIMTVDKVYDDYGREITKVLDDSDEQNEDTLSNHPYDYVSLYKLQNFELKLINKLSYLGHNLQKNETRLTNYSLIKRLHKQYSDYYIKYKLTNKYNNKIDNKIINLPSFENGNNHFVINFDGINGKIDVFCNAKLIASDSFENGKFLSESLFNESFLIGTNSYFYIPLFKFLNQNNYFVNNLQIKYFKLYNNTLSQDEIKILNLQHYKVDNIMLNIPCGNRNKSETISRMFKQSVPGFKTNKFDIIIKNINVNNEDKIKLSNVLRKILTDKLPLQTHINNFKFKFTS